MTTLWLCWTFRQVTSSLLSWCLRDSIEWWLHARDKTASPPPAMTDIPVQDSVQSLRARRQQFQVVDVIALHKVCPSSLNIKAYWKCDLKMRPCFQPISSMHYYQTFQNCLFQLFFRRNCIDRKTVSSENMTVVTPNKTYYYYYTARKHPEGLTLSHQLPRKRGQCVLNSKLRQEYLVLISVSKVTSMLT